MHRPNPCQWACCWKTRSPPVKHRTKTARKPVYHGTKQLVPPRNSQVQKNNTNATLFASQNPLFTIEPRKIAVHLPPISTKSGRFFVGLALVCIALASPAMAQPPPNTTPPCKTNPKTSSPPQQPPCRGNRPPQPDTATSDLLEISFGTAQIFATPELDLATKELLPTTSALFIGEWFFWRSVGLVTLLNLPLSTAKSIRNNQVIESFSPPTLAVGLSWAPVSWAFRETSRFEMQLALLGGALLASDGRLFPLAAFRLRLLQNEGFALYLGAAFAFRVESSALIYGVGHRF